MPRQFSVTRRRIGLIDILINIDPLKIPPIEFWEFEASDSFNGPFISLEKMGNCGKRSKTVRDYSFNDSFRGKVRFVFNPDDYPMVKINDLRPIYLRLKTRDLGSNDFCRPGGVHVVIPYTPSGHPPLHLNGDAPHEKLEIQLPKNCHQFIFENLSGVNMYLSISSSGSEYKLKPQTILELFDTTSSEIHVRSEGVGGCEFEAICTIQNAADIA
ncbi:MAG TPA: hypothetical protein ENI76_10190 [Ignavibacteria bacterium]|nr:hypothetical protein [Ignavibacteria bacterium]